MLPGKLWLLLLLGACFNPHYQDPMCSSTGECPSGLTCVAGVCRASVPDDDAATIDEDSSQTLDDAPVDTLVGTPDALFTVVFQQGLNGYTGTQDTYLDGGSPTATRGTDLTARWRFETNKERSALLKFTGLFEAGKVPTTATITSATLTFQMENDNATGGLVEVAIPWDQATATFDTFGADPGVDLQDVGMFIGNLPTTNGAHNIDVKTTVERWQNGTIANHGWVFMPSAAGSGESAFRTSEALLDKPTLTITYY
jgi:hypothetical protein